MLGEFGGEAADIRSRTAAIIRDHHDALSSDLAAAMSDKYPALDAGSWRNCASVLLRVMAAAVETGAAEAHSAGIVDFERFFPPLTTHDLTGIMQEAERLMMDEVALDDRLGATSEPWSIVTHAVRRATLEILATHADYVAAREVPIILRDDLTTLLVPGVFELALAHELERALRYQHPFAVVLIDIDDLSGLNRDHGRGVGDRVLERLGILARRFFRNDDWVARYGDDSIAVLMPETTPDQAGAVALRFREAVESRLVLLDHKTEAQITVTVSAAVIGAELLQVSIEPSYVLAEAEAGLMRAKMTGRNRIERIALSPTSVTIFGAATLLCTSARDVVRLIKSGALPAGRRGRHVHIDRDALDAYRRSAAGGRGASGPGTRG